MSGTLFYLYILSALFVHIFDFMFKLSDDFFTLPEIAILNEFIAIGIHGDKMNYTQREQV
jgi:hypothetical protein